MTVHRHLPGERLAEAVVANGFIFTTQVPRDGNADARAQTADVLEQTDQVLADLGSDKSKVIDVTIFLPDLADVAGMNAAWDAWVVPGHTPTRATVQAKLVDPSWKIEIKVIAVR
ncbi:RidA family protein [Neisseriaceae bacterium JH1-16]|nr:RidA family protein [Neisseriaceae bacterium JH1-16]